MLIDKDLRLSISGCFWLFYASKYIVKTYPASPAYMYQEAFSMYPIKRYWRAKVDGTWRGWIEL